MANDKTGQRNLEYIAARHTRQVMQDNWQVAAGVAAGSTAFTVALRSPSGVVPNVGAALLADYTSAEIEFFPITPGTTPTNMGFATKINSVTSSGGITTVNLSDALPAALVAGDKFTIFRSVNVVVQVVAPENITQVGGQSVPAPDIPRVPVIESVDLVPLTSIANQVGGSPGPDFASFLSPFAGKATALLTLPTSSVVHLLVKLPGQSAGSYQDAGALESGAALNANEPYTIQWPVSAGATYALSVATTQVGNLFVSVEGATN